MTTLENLFLGIFERKDWIIEQLQREADAYTEQLASRLLIDGITPPPCLLNPRFNSRSSNPHELKKEDIISKLLLRPPRASVAYSSGGPSHYYRPAVTGGHGPLPNQMSMETHAPNKALHVTNEPPVTLSCPNDNIECNLNVVNEQYNNVNSPQKEIDARISSIYAAPDSSLARIQRSKSRQKARELRNSGKTSAKSCLGDENRTRISFNGVLLSKSDIHQVTQDKCPSEVDKSNGINQGKSLQQSCHDNGVIEGVNLVDTSLGSYEAKKTVTGITHGTQRQSKLYSGRITRSRFSTQQTSGTNKSIEKDNSVSCNPKEGKGANSSSVGDLNLEANASKKFLDAVETSQVVKDVKKPDVPSNIIASRVTRSKSVSIKDVKKPVISSNIAASRVTRSKSGSVNNKEDGEIVVGNVPAVTQPVYSGMKLDLINMHTESDGLVLNQSSECFVKPKQLNFDEMDGCDSSKVSKKRKSGQKCSPSMDSGSLKDHKSSGTFFEQKEQMENVLSSQSKDPVIDSSSSKDHKSSGTFFEQELPMENEVSIQLEDEKTHSLDLDECAKGGTMDIGLDMNGDTVVEDVDQNADVSLHDDVAVFCEVIKQGDKDSEIFLDKEVRTSFQDLGSSKSKEFEHGTSLKLSNLKLNSEKVNTWPRDPQKKVDDQRNCFSDSRGFKIHAQKDAIHCDLEASKTDIHVTKSDDIKDSDKIVHDDMTCDLPENTEATVMEMDDDMAVSVDGSDENMPVYEGFTINEEEFKNSEVDGIDFDTLEIPTTTIERASILEQICQDSITNTPFSQFSSFKQHEVEDLYKIMPDGLVEDMDLENKSDCHYSFPNSVPFSGTPLKSKNYYSSPVGKFYDRSASSSGSSENRLSSNPELTCFPIEEDPNSNEESENDEIQETKEKIPVTETETVKRENDDDVAVPKPANKEPPSGKMKYRERCSSNSVNIEVNVLRTFDKVKYKSKFERTPSLSTRASVKRNTSIQTQNSKIKSTIKRPSQKEGKRNNIVSNITSFVSLVQQKQAAAACPGKREIKVKALEAAEVAKRREEEKEKERKMKKEALKMERARIEKENAREMEINKKRKMEEIRKKEADVAARKKQREEDERKQLAKKRKINEARKEQKRGGKVVNVGKKGAENASESTKENKNANVVVQEEISVPENVDKEKSPTQVGLTDQESCWYEISAYKCSDGEDEDEDDLPNNKFVPSWASKRAVGMVLPMQQEVDPETIFPVESFCSMDEVLLPRRLQAQ